MIPHRDRLVEEIQEVFRNAKFAPSPDAGGDLEVADICPGYLLVLDHCETELNIRLAEDWTCALTFTEIILHPDAPDWDRFRRWLWDACYEEVRKVMAAICKSMGISIPWPDVIERDGRKYFKGREPTEHIPDLYGRVSMGPGTSHVLTGGVSCGKSTFALRMALEAAQAGKEVALVTTEMSTTTLVNKLVRDYGVSKVPGNLQFISPQKVTIASILQAAERARGDVRIIDSPLQGMEDQPKRLAMKTQSEVFVVLQASRTMNESNVLDRMNKRCRTSVEGVYWVQTPNTVTIVQHPNLGGSRFRIDRAAKPRARLVGNLPIPPPVTAWQTSEIAAWTQTDLTAEFALLLQQGFEIKQVQGERTTLDMIFPGFTTGQKIMVGGQTAMAPVIEDIMVPTGFVRISYA